MRKVFYNPDKAQEEKELKDKAKIEAEKKKAYFEALRKNRNFVKYVIDDIIRYEIEEAQKSPTNIDGVSITGVSNEVVKSALVEKLGCLKASQNILNKILNS